MVVGRLGEQNQQFHGANAASCNSQTPVLYRVSISNTDLVQ